MATKKPRRERKSASTSGGLVLNGSSRPLKYPFVRAGKGRSIGYVDRPSKLPFVRSRFQ